MNIYTHIFNTKIMEHHALRRLKCMFSILGGNLQYVSLSGLCQACYVHFRLGCVSQPGSSLSLIQTRNTPEDVLNLNMHKNPIFVGTVPTLNQERETEWIRLGFTDPLNCACEKFCPTFSVDSFSMCSKSNHVKCIIDFSLRRVINCYDHQKNKTKMIIWNA